MHAPRHRRTAVLVALTGTALALTACAGPAPTTNAAATGPAATSSASPTPTPTPSPTPTGVVGIPAGGPRCPDVRVARQARARREVRQHPERPAAQRSAVRRHRLHRGGGVRPDPLRGRLHSTLPASVGPVRSARISDIELLPQYGRPAFAYSGAQHRLRPVLAKASIYDVTGDRGPSGYWRVRPCRPLRLLRPYGAAAHARPARVDGPGHRVHLLRPSPPAARP